MFSTANELLFSPTDVGMIGPNHISSHVLCTRFNLLFTVSAQYVVANVPEPQQFNANELYYGF